MCVEMNESWWLTPYMCIIPSKKGGDRKAKYEVKLFRPNLFVL